MFSRRHLLLASAAASLPVAAGCSGEDVQEKIDSLDTDTIESATVALKGLALVSCLAGPRIVMLPVPGVRIIAVCLVVSSVATKLAIEYLDVELRKRYIAEAVSEEEAKAIEGELAVTFTMQNGETEKVVLGPNQYEEANA